MISIKFEEQLRNSADASDGTYDQAKARATVAYYCSRMIIVGSMCKLWLSALMYDGHQAWRDGNDAIAQFMLEKITGIGSQDRTPTQSLHLTQTVLLH